jgi:hypothetical protein
MFDFLKGGKVYLTLKLDQPNKFFRFGDPVRGTLTVENEKRVDRVLTGYAPIRADGIKKRNQ